MSDTQRISESRLLYELEALRKFAKEELRRRFDEAAGMEIINIIDQTRDFGFHDLAQQMISDFCTADHCRDLWNMHENFIKRESTEGNDPTERQAKSFVHASENGHEL